MLDSITSRGIVSIIGGFLIALVIGTTYLWGIISIYITSYFRLVEDPTLQSQITAMVFPFMIFGQAIAMPFGVKLMKKIKAKHICIATGILIGISFYMASLTKSFYTFVVLFGIFGGVLIGFLYMIPVAHCYKYFPKKKGMVSGIIVAGSGLGTFLFSMVAIQAINPHNAKPGENGYFTMEIAENVPKFLKQIALICSCSIIIGSFLLLDLLPGMDPYAEAHKHQAEQPLNVEEGKRKTLVELMNNQFEIHHDQQEQVKKPAFGQSMLELGALNDNDYSTNQSNPVVGFWNWETANAVKQQYGTYLPPDKYAEKGKLAGVSTSAAPLATSAAVAHVYHAPGANQCPRVRDAVTVKIFWVLFACMFCGTYFGFLVSGNYKSFGKKYINNDAFLTFVGAVGSMGNGLSRFAWATLLDRFDFKCLYTTLLIINSCLALTIYYAVRIPQVYLVYVFMTYVCYGGHLGMFPAVASQVFGVRNGSQIYGILFIGFASANALQFIVVKSLKENYGYQPIFWLGVVFSGLAIFIANSFEFKYDWSNKIRQHNERKKLSAR